MKKALLLLLCLILSLSFSSCKSESQSSHSGSLLSTVERSRQFDSVQAPTGSIIKDDLESKLTEFMGYDLSIKNVVVSKSLTDDESYAATINLTAESKYADFDFETNVSYTNYDQGWMLDSCSFNIKQYQVVRYPDEAKMTELKAAQGIDDLIQISTSMPNDVGSEFISSTGELSISWSSIAIAKCIVNTTWVYDVDHDDWKFFNQEFNNYNFYLTKELEGEYELYKDSGAGTITITNVTETGFDICVDAEYYRADAFHVDFKSGYMYYEDGDFSLNYENPNVSFQTTEKATYGKGSYSGNAIVQLGIYDHNHSVAGFDYNVRCLIRIDGVNSSNQQWLATSQTQFIAK